MSGRMSVAELRAAQAKRKPSKYRNKRVQVDGIVFDSIDESERWRVLCLLRDAGEISDLRYHQVFRLEVKGPFGTMVRKYEADFTYLDHAGTLVVEDVKSPVTRQKPEYRIKRELMAVLHGLEIREVMFRRKRRDACNLTTVRV